MFINTYLNAVISQEKRFIFGKGESQPPTAFVWNDDEIQLHNNLVAKIHQRDKERKDLGPS